MNLYALVHNNQIQVGPRDWRYSFFLGYILDEELDSTELPRRAPEQAVITEQWQLLPITNLDTPSLEAPFERLVGPFWAIHEDHITGYYDKEDAPIHEVKGVLKNKLANNRYRVETGNLTYTFPDGQEVDIYTEREERMIYLNTMLVLPDDGAVSFKFKNDKFRNGVTKQQLSEIVAMGTQHIAEAFGWEAMKVDEVDAATTIEELKAIELRHPIQILADEERENRFGPSTAD